MHIIFCDLQLYSTQAHVIKMYGAGLLKPHFKHSSQLRAYFFCYCPDRHMCLKTRVYRHYSNLESSDIFIIGCYSILSYVPGLIESMSGYTLGFINAPVTKNLEVARSALSGFNIYSIKVMQFCPLLTPMRWQPCMTTKIITIIMCTSRKVQRDI